MMRRNTPNPGGSYPPDHTAGFGVNQKGAALAKAFNRDLIYIQGFRQIVGAGVTVEIDIALNSPGKWLHGLAIIPKASDDLSDCQISYSVNNNNILTKVGANNFNPGYAQGMLFAPTPQPLFGTDTLTLQITNNGSAQVVLTANVFYVPRAGVK